MAFDFKTQQIRELREAYDSSAQAAGLTNEPKHLLTMERDLVDAQLTEFKEENEYLRSAEGLQPRGLVEKKVLDLQAGLASRDLELVALSKKSMKLEAGLKTNQEWNQNLSDFCLKVGNKGVASAEAMHAVNEQVRRDWHLRDQAESKADRLEMEANRLRTEVDKLLKENTALKAGSSIAQKEPKVDTMERSDELPRKKARVHEAPMGARLKSPNVGAETFSIDGLEMSLSNDIPMTFLGLISDWTGSTQSETVNERIQARFLKGNEERAFFPLFKTLSGPGSVTFWYEKATEEIRGWHKASERFIERRDSKIADLKKSHQAEISELKRIHKNRRKTDQAESDRLHQEKERAVQEKERAEQDYSDVWEQNQELSDRCGRWKKEYLWAEAEANQSIRYRQERDEARDFIRSKGFPRPGIDERAGPSVFRPSTPEGNENEGIPSPPLTGGAHEGSPGRGTKRRNSSAAERADNKRARTSPTVGRDESPSSTPNVREDPLREAVTQRTMFSENESDSNSHREPLDPVGPRTPQTQSPGGPVELFPGRTGRGR
ncbi:hypothetical protein LTR27_008996 [Elasticomyces elasticus]|nr:hypothetical protein LTR27_008996 [Elasticomyces elasticus]